MGPCGRIAVFNVRLWGLYPLQVFVAPHLVALSQTVPKYPIHAQVPLRFSFQS